jgi:DNA (cytosine-5)-methyltransferase 1
MAKPTTAGRPPQVRAFLGDDEIIVDLFAGGGGASTGIERALGRSPDIAINHSPEAIAMHSANHPKTRHFISDVYEVDPVIASAGRPIALLWLSPDCTHHSKAKGGKPRSQKIRGLAWAAMPWAQHCRPRLIVLENVEEWIGWGPVDRATGQPIKARKGQTFRAWCEKLESFGYVIEHRLLRACDFGAPTYRRRLFLQARCDGRPIVWPEPTHAKAPGVGQLELGARVLKPYRTAAECIDWSIACPSVFTRRKRLSDKTEARLVRGVGKFVIGNARPFLVAVNHGGVGRNDVRVHDGDAPMPTITGGCRGGHAVVAPMIVKAKTHGGGGNEPIATDGGLGVAVPYLVHRSNGERPGQAPRIYDIERPLGTIVAQGEKHGFCAAFLAKHYGDRPTGGFAGGSPVDVPAGTITAQDHQSKEQHVDAPLGTLDTHDRYAAVEAQLAVWSPDIEERAHQVYGLMVKYGYVGPGLDHESRLVTVRIDGETFVIYDIGMRMLVPRELFRATGFPDSYVINPIGPKGKPLTKTAQIRACGNAVPPDFVDAIIGAAFERAARTA